MNKFAGIGRNMTVSNKYFHLYLRNELRPYDLNATEGIVMLMMYRHDDCSDDEYIGNTQDEIIKKIHYDKGVMTRTMKGLEEKDFVKRNLNPMDSRSYIFSLTPKGLEFKETLINILRQWNNHLLKGIDEHDLKTVERALEIMAKNSLMYFNDNSNNR
jgi:DNA-binding MarR family transcriptional regulator